MKTIEYSTVIRKPITEVFAYIENLENKPIWETGVVEAKVVSGKYEKEGSVIQVTTKLLGKKIEAVAEVIEFEENKIVTCRAQKPFVHEISNIYEEVNEGTKFIRRATGDYDNGSKMFKLASPLMKKKIEQTFKKTVENAKKILESS